MNSLKVNLRELIVFLLISLIYSFLPLLIVTRWDWWPGWVYAALMIFSNLGSRILAAKINPGILAERAKSMQAKDAKIWDKKLAPLVGMFGPILVLLVSSLDARFGWNPHLERGMTTLGLVIMTLGLLFSTWAFLENKFFSGIVRIQTDRGHHVVKSGPYRFVRHPGYAGAIWMYLGIPIYFDAIWGLLPALGLLAAFILRTALEDKTLQDELPGYKEYTQKTKYRLLPGVW